MQIKIKSWRGWGLYIVPFIVMGWLFLTDPDGGFSTRDMLQNTFAGLLGLVVAHFARKALFDYLKLEDVAREARRSATGAGMVFLGVCMVLAVLLLVFTGRAHAQDVRTYVPKGAYTYAPVLKAEQVRLWADHPAPAMLGSLVEVESCISLKHSRCWNPAARLKTYAEEGAGFGQITRAYRKDGSLRFDALAAARSLDPSLREWSWSNVYQRPDLQLRAIVAMNRDCYKRLGRLVADPQRTLEMCDAAYNGGYTGLQSERRACGQRPGCNPQVWFANVEAVCLKSKVAKQGYGRSACQINRDHVRDVAVVRRAKYKPLLEAAV